MGKKFSKSNNKLQILSTFDKHTATKLVSVLSSQGIKSNYFFNNSEYVLEIKYYDLKKAIEILAYCITKKDFKVYCWLAPYWQQYAPEFWQKRNEDINEV
ncbi:MAG: hypothetical protein IKM43_02135 [Clostridia bacterium]|nr:hypothetical protein [Clostridia bacterium]